MRRSVSPVFFYQRLYQEVRCLLDLEDPSHVVGRCLEPILEPQESYETEGFFGNVVFTDGVVVRADGTVDIYYGAADETLCLAQESLHNLINLCLTT